MPAVNQQGIKIMEEIPSMENPINDAKKWHMHLEEWLGSFQEFHKAGDMTEERIQAFFKTGDLYLKRLEASLLAIEMSK